jgi:hypothetical protein
LVPLSAKSEGIGARIVQRVMPAPMLAEVRLKPFHIKSR